MANVVQETPQEFWRPPSPVIVEEVSAQPDAPAMAEACPRCTTEFLLGSRFCHTCGQRRPLAISESARSDAAEMAGLWERAVAKTYAAITGFHPGKIWRAIKFPAWLSYLHFHEIKRWVGLPTASLVAFLVGLCCVAGALLVGLITAKTFVDWQAIQFYRAEWLLAATAAFVAGILLKRPSDRDSE